MKPEEFEQATGQILTNLTDQGKVSEYLTQLNDVYKTTHTTNQTLQEQQSKHEKEIQALKETNMNLFLKINTPPETTTIEPSESQEEKLTYEKLLDTMGGK